MLVKADHMVTGHLHRAVSSDKKQRAQIRNLFWHGNVEFDLDDGSLHYGFYINKRSPDLRAALVLFVELFYYHFPKVLPANFTLSIEERGDSTILFFAKDQVDLFSDADRLGGTLRVSMVVYILAIAMEVIDGFVQREFLSIPTSAERLQYCKEMLATEVFRMSFEDYMDKARDMRKFRKSHMW